MSRSRSHRAGRRPAARGVTGVAVATLLVTAATTWSGGAGGLAATLIGAEATPSPDPSGTPPAAGPSSSSAQAASSISPAPSASPTPEQAPAGAPAAEPGAAPGVPAGPAATDPAGIALPPAVAPPAAGDPAPPPPAQEANPNCTLIVPPAPLTAAGLATPYRLVATDPGEGPCHEATAAQSAFVQAAIITADGKLSLYDPLVVDDGTEPAADPVPAQVPAGATVGIWFGSNGDELTLRASGGRRGGSLSQGRCVNGLRGSIFGQFAYCNAEAFFGAAHRAIRAGRLTVPPVGTARDGRPCPTVRDFSVVDQDQSDNVNTHYLATTDGRIAQPGTRTAVDADARDLANGSDNRLLAEFILPALGCAPFTAPDQSNGGAPATALPLQELQAALRQPAPVALVPLTDPMTLVGERTSRSKTSLFRVGVDQPPVGGRGGSGDGRAYCRALYGSPQGIQRVFAAQQVYAAGRSPNVGAATDLFTFLAARASDSFGLLSCDRLLGQTNPVVLTTNDAGQVSAARYVPGGAPPAADPVASPSPSASVSPSPSVSPSKGTPPAASRAASPAVSPAASPAARPTAGPAPSATAPSARAPSATAPSATAPSPSLGSPTSPPASAAAATPAGAPPE